jgi:hypothetical protein
LTENHFIETKSHFIEGLFIESRPIEGRSPLFSLVSPHHVQSEPFSIFDEMAFDEKSFDEVDSMKWHSTNWYGAKFPVIDHFCRDLAVTV